MSGDHDLSSLRERFARAADDEPSLCAIVAFLPGGPRGDDPDPAELRRRLFAGERCGNYEDYKEVMESLRVPLWKCQCGAHGGWWGCRLYMHRRRAASREPDRFLSLAEEAARAAGAGRDASRWLVHLAESQTWDTPGMSRMSPPASPDRWHVWMPSVSSVSAWVIGRHVPGADPHVVTHGSTSQAGTPDGPCGDRWVRWNGTRHDVKEGVVFRLIAWMWDRDSAGYDSLMGTAGAVWRDPVQDRTVGSYCNKANNDLGKIPGFPWRLKSNSVDRVVTRREV
jgi:hypothetical protein